MSVICFVFGTKVIYWFISCPTTCDLATSDTYHANVKGQW